MKKTALHRWIEQRCHDLSMHAWPDTVLVVEIEKQTLTLVEAGKPAQVYTVSTSKNPPSCVENSFGTPSGLHEIAEKIGADAPAGTVFESRVPIGNMSDMSQDELKPNLITSRILWLRGLEPGVNAGPGVDTYNRYVYIHGTQQEYRIGQPFSGGCVEMKNADIMELFSRVGIGTWVAFDSNIPLS